MRRIFKVAWRVVLVFVISCLTTCAPIPNSVNSELVPALSSERALSYETVIINGESSQYWMRNLPVKLIIMESTSVNNQGEEEITLYHQNTDPSAPVVTRTVRVDVRLLQSLPNHIVKRKPSQ
jgi:hypothetical protein